MANFCTKCGNKLRVDDKFCTNCGTKIIKDEKFCAHCGNKIRKEDSFCIRCGAKINKYDTKQCYHSSNQYSDSIEKNRAKKELNRVTGGIIFSNKIFDNELRRNGLDVVNTGNAIRQQVEKEIDLGQIRSAEVELRVIQLIDEYKIKKEEEKRILKMIDELFESSEIKFEINYNNIDQKYILSIKDNLKNKLIDKTEDMSEEEIKQFIKTELEKAIKQEKARIAKEKEKARIAEEKKKARIAEEQERRRKELEWIEINGGGYCSLSCRHCYEEFLDSGGGIVGDFDSEGYVEYYCHLGHSISFGSLCKDYE